MAVWTLWPLLVVFFGLAAAASLISIRLGVSVAIVEIFLGAVAGNALGVNTIGQDWVSTLASLGGVVLTFLAGTEIDVAEMRRNWKDAVTIGIISFLAPFVAASAFSWFVLHWTFSASLLTGVALSTTSVAVVYVVLVESGLTTTATGKLILAACFVTDLATVLALSGLFVPPNILFLALALAVALAVVFAPPITRWLFAQLQWRSSEPEVRLLLFLLVALGGLAVAAGSFAVLPAYLIGFAMAPVLQKRRDVMLRLRAAAFTLLTPFFFLYAGLNISATAVAAGALLILVLFGVKVSAKFAGVLPITRRVIPAHSMYVTLLMSTGLTFGTITSLYGLSAGIITQSQFSVILTVVLLTAVVPTLIAQQWFRPAEEPPRRRRTRAPPPEPVGRRA